MGSTACKEEFMTSLSGGEDKLLKERNPSVRSPITVIVNDKRRYSKPKAMKSKYINFSVFDLTEFPVLDKPSPYAIFPTRILHLICEYLTCAEVVNMTKVCKGFHTIINTNEFWQIYLDLITLTRSGHERPFSFRPSLSSHRLQIESSKERFVHYYNPDYFYGHLYSLQKDSSVKDKVKIVISGSKKVGKTRIVETYALSKKYSYNNSKVEEEEEEGEVGVEQEEGEGEIIQIKKKKKIKYEKDEYVPTIGASFENISICQKSSVLGDNTLGIELWDVSGDERYNSLRPIYYNDSLCICLCFSFFDAKSFEDVKSEVDELLRNNLNMMIVGSMADLLYDQQQQQEEIKVTREEVDKFITSRELENNENYLGYIEVSSNSSFREVRSKNIHTLISFISQQHFEKERETSFED